MGHVNKIETRKYRALVLPDRVWKWCVAWQTPIMPVPAYWYFLTEQEADAAITRLKRRRTP